MPRLAPSYEHVPGGRVLAALSRRVRTLIIAAVLFVILFVLLLTMPVPYVVLSPGPTYNTLGTDATGNTIIKIEGKTPAHTTGNLNLTTVAISSQSVTALQALSAWLRGDEVVVPRAAVYPPGETEQQTNQKNTQDFQFSQADATAAALCELGYPKGFGVVEVVSDGPSHGILEPGDRFLSVDGKPVHSRAALDAVLTAHQPGDKIDVVVNRHGKTDHVVVKLGKSPDTGKAYLGVLPDNTCLAPFTVDVGLGNQIGGPSAGLMFALGIMDKVGTVDLTGGRFIAGTGTIDPQGQVGPIGGIQLKMIAARDKGATIFLAPAGNCDDVRGATPDGLKVVKVTTLHGAVQDLLRIQHGRSVPSC